MVKVFGTMFDVNIIQSTTNNTLMIQYTELDTSLESSKVCKRNISNSIEFEKHSADEYIKNHWFWTTSFFKFYGKHSPPSHKIFWN